MGDTRKVLYDCNGQQIIFINQGVANTDLYVCQNNIPLSNMVIPMLRLFDLFGTDTELIIKRRVHNEDDFVMFVRPKGRAKIRIDDFQSFSSHQSTISSATFITECGGVIKDEIQTFTFTHDDIITLLDESAEAAYSVEVVLMFPLTGLAQLELIHVEYSLVYNLLSVSKKIAIKCVTYIAGCVSMYMVYTYMPRVLWRVAEHFK
ncbi:hypothetical protein BgiBS90_028882 [Biomphalaria glabrata]|nr:hypothetical protein BgiBS90_028882 [Biomphalaria glabrata]